MLVQAFLRSGHDEAQARLALADAATPHRDAPETAEARAGGSGAVRAFMDEALPHADDAAFRLATSLIEATPMQVGRRFCGTDRSEAEIATFADAIADMFCACLRNVRPPRHGQHLNTDGGSEGPGTA